MQGLLFFDYTCNCDEILRFQLCSIRTYLRHFIMRRVAVIGGGAAGLVTLKHLLQAHKYFPTDPVEVWLFEREDSVGGTFRHRTYEDGEVRVKPCHLYARFVASNSILIAGVVPVFDRIFRFPHSR
jgi:predicted NAD/FAD-binding protein